MKHFDIYCYYVWYIYYSKSLTSKGNQGKLTNKKSIQNTIQHSIVVDRNAFEDKLDIHTYSPHIYFIKNREEKQKIKKEMEKMKIRSKFSRLKSREWECCIREKK